MEINIDGILHEFDVDKAKELGILTEKTKYPSWADVCERFLETTEIEYSCDSIYESIRALNKVLIMNILFEKTIKLTEADILGKLCEDFGHYDHEIRNKFIAKMLKFAYLDLQDKPVFNTTVDVDMAESLLQELVFQLMKSWSNDREMRKRYAKLYDMVNNIKEDIWQNYQNNKKHFYLCICFELF